MNKLLPILLVVVLSGCAAIHDGSFTLVQPVMKMKTYSFPTKDFNNTKSIGESLVDLAYRNVGPGFKLKEEVYDEWLHGIPPTVGVRVYPGKAFISSKDTNNICYGTFKGIIYDVTLSIEYPSPTHICVRTSPKANQSKLYLISTGGLSTRRDFVADYELINDMKAPIQENSFKQEFIYNGKTGQSIKFIYREFEDGFNRSTFQQDVQYDLNESNIIGFKELRLEVIEATNQNITYKVLNNFSMKDYE